MWSRSFHVSRRFILSLASHILPRVTPVYRFLLILFLLTPAFRGSAQRLPCGTMDYNRDQIKIGQWSDLEREFEDWLEGLRRRRTTGTSAVDYTIPVVVHIIHNGEPVGAGLNIPDAQVQSQIRALNADFRRENADAANTLGAFSPLASAMPVHFVLADKDPDGNPTTGIIRVKGVKTEYKRSENAEVKALSYWPAENYINIWVCNFADYLGFTQFPVTTLPGIGAITGSRLTDGIMISHAAFGSIDDGAFNLSAPYVKGRILTHEMGHFFGLRHIWGDGTDCTSDDYVADTPTQSSSTTGCPSGLFTDCAVGGRMYQNYMDYTNDACMNLFTEGQVERMMLVLENSPRRKSLLIAAGDITAVPFPELFSPNNDGVNDYWIWANTLDYVDCRLLIYDRFGAVVYDKVGYDNTWNGRGIDGRQLEEEAYYYEIRCDGSKNHTGGVRIIR